jgi:pSer/pThr/pTyr-binding forkhead associated (FHA) protein
MTGENQPGEIRPRQGYAGERGAEAGAERLLCVDESERAMAIFRALEREHAVVIEQSSLEALEALERADDFAVVLVASEPARSVATGRFLEAARAISPTTARVVLAHGTPVNAEPSFEAAFRVVSAAAPIEVLIEAISRALHYHRLLGTSPAQPVDVSRVEHHAMLPPARPPQRQQDLPVWHGFIESARQCAGAPVSIEEQAPALPLLVFETAPRVGVVFDGRTVELLHGDTIIGRSRTCHIAILDPRISRRHACLSNDGHQLTVRNLSSTNALSVNGKILEPEAAQHVAIGDRIAVGSREIAICALGDYCPSLEPTEQVSVTRPPETPTAASTLATLAQVAEKYFVLGQSKEAERLSKPLLAGLLRYCEEGRAPSAPDVELAVGLTLRIAEANRSGEWIDYLFNLFSALGKPMSPDVVDRLYRLVPEAQGAKMACFRRYADMLLARQDRFSPGERFLVRRIQGLETPLMMSAHL